MLDGQASKNGRPGLDAANESSDEPRLFTFRGL
jgi:hypothetical protein